MNYKAVIFDFDGTVCQTGEGIRKSAAYALESLGFAVPEDENELNFFKRRRSLLKNTGSATPT